MVDQNMVQKNLTKEIYKTNLFLLKGLKETTEISFRKTCSLLKKRKKKNPLIQIKQAVEIIKPFCETKSVKEKNKVTRVPVEITRKRQQLLATRFFLTAIREKKRSFLHEKLSNELIGICSFNGSSLKIFESFQKNVEMNKVFIRYRS